jgi:predicted enzyme related to lactoylglutathione lyase
MQETRMRLQPIVYVTDMDRAVAWYSAVLGVQPGYQSPAWTSLAVGDTTLGLHIIDVRPAQSHVALSLVATEPLEDVMVRLEASGIAVAKPIATEDFGRSLVIVDPDGTAIQVNEHRH